MSDEQKIKTTVDKLIAQKAQDEKIKAQIVENEKDFAMALNGMGASPNGKLVLRTLIRACGVFTPKEGVDGVALIETNAKRNLYLKHIRPYLEPSIRQELENG